MIILQKKQHFYFIFGVLGGPRLAFNCSSSSGTCVTVQAECQHAAVPSSLDPLVCLLLQELGESG